MNTIIVQGLIYFMDIDRFEANQTIVFTIKFMIDEEGNSSLIGSPAS